MVRLCPTRAMVVAALTLGLFGCSGQKLEGRWRGPLPLDDAKACVTNLYGNLRFDVYCEQAAWVGAGRYEATSDRIRLDFETLARRGEIVRRPVPIDLRYEGHGNELKIGRDRLNLVWSRRRP